MKAIVNLFVILTILGALLRGVAWALHNYRGVSRKGLVEGLLQLKDREELACNIDKVVERGLLRPFDWIEMLGKMVMTNIIIEPRRKITYLMGILLIFLLNCVVGYIAAGLFAACFICNIVAWYARERTMRNVFHSEVQS